MKRDSDFSLTAKSVWTEKPRESVARRILRVRVSNDSARWAVSTVSRFEKVRLPGRIDVVGSSRDVL